MRIRPALLALFVAALTACADKESPPSKPVHLVRFVNGNTAPVDVLIDGLAVSGALRRNVDVTTRMPAAAAAYIVSCRAITISSARGHLRGSMPRSPGPRVTTRRI